MATIAKTKKLKFSKMQANDVLATLFSMFLLYLRGEEIPKLNGEKLEFNVEWHDDGSFKPDEQSIAEVFKKLDAVWRRCVHRRFKEEAWNKYEGLFKHAVSEEWKASKSTLTATESQS